MNPILEECMFVLVIKLLKCFHFLDFRPRKPSAFLNSHRLLLKNVEIMLVFPSPNSIHYIC